MLKCADEGVIFTGRRFGSREDVDHAPLLEIDYLIVPVIERIELQSTHVQVRFTAWPNHTYDLQARSSTQTSWQTIATFQPEPEKVKVLYSEPATAASRFYRLLAR
jgi:hypothetical protein